MVEALGVEEVGGMRLVAWCTGVLAVAAVASVDAATIFCKSKRGALIAATATTQADADTDFAAAAAAAASAPLSFYTFRAP